MTGFIILCLSPLAIILLLGAQAGALALAGHPADWNAGLNGGTD